MKELIYSTVKMLGSKKRVLCTILALFKELTDRKRSSFNI
jgi:hypothetical protein